MNNYIDSNECLVCKSKNLDVISPLKGKHIIYSKLYLTRCNSCKLVFANPMPNEEKLIEYNSSYFNTAHGDFKVTPNAVSFFRKENLLEHPFYETLLGKEDRYWVGERVKEGKKSLYDPKLEVEHHYTTDGNTWKGIA